MIRVTTPITAHDGVAHIVPHQEAHFAVGLRGQSRWLCRPFLADEGLCTPLHDRGILLLEPLAQVLGDFQPLQIVEDRLRIMVDRVAYSYKLPQ